jgi:uncharacterized membrane protein
MEKGRLEAFSDGVLAIIITIMVLEMKVPSGSGIAALRAEAPIFFGYVLSYANVGIFWANHHHMLHAADRIDGRVLWANLFLLFWLSLVPFAIRWMDQTGYAALPTAAYGVALAMAGLGYNLVQGALIACNGRDSRLARAVGRDIKGKLTFGAYVASIPLAFVRPWISIVIFVCVALSWFIPDRRIESRLKA